MKTLWKWLIWFVAILAVVTVTANVLPDEFFEGVVDISPDENVTACTQEAKQCPDGSFVSRSGPSCEFDDCATVISEFGSLKVAFTGDMGKGENAEKNLRHIVDELGGKGILVINGDFAYGNEDKGDALEFLDMLERIVPEDIIIIFTKGNHDRNAWSTYQNWFKDEVNNNPDLICSGDLGVKSECHYKGLHMLLLAPGLGGDGLESYVSSKLEADDSVFSFCNQHYVQKTYQAGGKGDQSGWGTYRACLNGGAVVATAHEHSYWRSCLMSDFQNHKVVTCDNDFVVKPGQSFAFVSGLGGKSIRSDDKEWDWADAKYGKNEGASDGALFCDFNFKTKKANCYFKDRKGKKADAFSFISEN